MKTIEPLLEAYLWRARASVAIILLMSALALCTLVSYRLLPVHPASPGDIIMDEARFAGIRAVLPSRGTIGYLSDTGGRQQNPKAYYLTQYFLAPVVVAPDTAHEFVVANFISRAGIRQVAVANGFTVESDFSNGVALLRRRSR